MTDTNNVDTTGAFGVKKSNFTAQSTAFSGSATIDVVQGATNKKQTLTNFFKNAVSIAYAAGTDAYGTATLHGNTTDTVIAVATVPVLVAGTWVAGDAQNCTVTTAGRITYSGTATRNLQLSASFTLERKGSGTNTYRVYLAKNGSVIDKAYMQLEEHGSHDQAGALTWLAPGVVTADYFEIYVSNETDTDDVLLKEVIFRAYS